MVCLGQTLIVHGDAGGARSALEAACIRTRSARRAFVVLAWKDNSSNETAFIIERCVGTTCTNFAQVGQTGESLTTWRDSSVARRTTYRYRVKARNAAGDSAYSNIASATMP